MPKSVLACEEDDVEFVGGAIGLNGMETGEPIATKEPYGLSSGVDGGVVGAVLAFSFSNSNLSRSILVRS